MKDKENTMKRPIKAKSKALTARNLFAELSEGMKALAEERLGKRNLRLICQTNVTGGQKHEDKSLRTGET
jgi:hypothetical protein